MLEQYLCTNQKLDNMMYCLLESFKDWPVESIMKSQVAGYKKCVMPIFDKLVCVFLLNCDHICEPQK